VPIRDTEQQHGDPAIPPNALAIDDLWRIAELVLALLFPCGESIRPGHAEDP